MKRTTPIKVAAAFGAATVLAVAAPLAASAHVTVTPSSTAAASYSVLTFSVGHGCDGSPTTALTFSVPDSIESVTPTVNPGWTIGGSGNRVVYTADEPLPEGQRTTFELSVRLPELPAGERLDFPVLQECEAGSTEWAGVVAGSEEETEHPAPSIVLTEATDTGHAVDEQAAPEADSDDVVARVLGIGGLALGTVGAVIGLKGRRTGASK